MQALTEVLNKSCYGNSHLQMRQNPISFAEHSERSVLLYLKTVISSAKFELDAIKHLIQHSVFKSPVTKKTLPRLVEKENQNERDRTNISFTPYRLIFT